MLTQTTYSAYTRQPHCYFTLKAILWTLSKPLWASQELSLNHSSIVRVDTGLHKCFTLGQWIYRQWCGDRGCPWVAWRGPWVRGQGTKLCSSPPGCLLWPRTSLAPGWRRRSGNGLYGQWAKRPAPEQPRLDPGLKSFTQGSFQTTPTAIPEKCLWQHVKGLVLYAAASAELSPTPATSTQSKSGPKLLCAKVTLSCPCNAASNLSKSNL